jgi:hypothetical protein
MVPSDDPQANPQFTALEDSQVLLRLCMRFVLPDSWGALTNRALADAERR